MENFTACDMPKASACGPIKVHVVELQVVCKETLSAWRILLVRLSISEIHVQRNW